MIEEQERDERRNRVAIAVASAVAGVSATVVVLRCFPRAVVTVAGPSQVGRALRSLRSS